MGSNPNIPVAKVVVVQTPLGIIKVALPPTLPDSPDPVGIAMGLFQSSVEAGSDDPLMETLSKLKQMAEDGQSHPLHVGLLILQQMSDSGMLPPMTMLLEGSGVTEHDLAHARAQVPGGQAGLLTKLDNPSMN
jgi:hypothetical protein